MRWPWQKDPIDVLLAKLPETIVWAGKSWGLRIKKENGKIVIRYVSGLSFEERVVTKRGKEKVFKKRNYEYIIAAGGTKSLWYALHEMHKKLIKLKVIIE